jgi:hypothetical protein
MEFLSSRCDIIHFFVVSSHFLRLIIEFNYQLTLLRGIKAFLYSIITHLYLTRAVLYVYIKIRKIIVFSDIFSLPAVLRLRSDKHYYSI